GRRRTAATLHSPPPPGRSPRAPPPLPSGPPTPRGTPFPPFRGPPPLPALLPPLAAVRAGRGAAQGHTPYRPALRDGRVLPRLAVSRPDRLCLPNWNHVLP